MDTITFADTSDTIQVSYLNRWAPMYDYIKKVTKTMKLPPQDVRDSDGNDLDEELCNEELSKSRGLGYT